MAAILNSTGTLLTITGAVGTVSQTVALPMRWQTTEPIALLLNFSGGGPAIGTVSVQVSVDPNANPQAAINNPSAALTARWNNHDILVSITGDKNSSIVYPVAYLRMIINATVTGTVALMIGIPDPLP